MDCPPVSQTFHVSAVADAVAVIEGVGGGRDGWMDNLMDGLKEVEWSTVMDGLSCGCICNLSSS
jgi:hypothetical protein